MTAIAQAGAAEPPGGEAPKPARLRGPRRLPVHLRPSGNRRFFIGLAIAIALHLSLLLAFLAAPESLTQTRLGQPEADPEGVSVEIVDMADLRSRSNVPLEGAKPTPAMEAQPKPQPAEPQSEPQSEPEQAPPQPTPTPSKEPSRDRAEVIEAPGTPPPPQSEASEQKKQAQKKQPAHTASNSAPQKRVLDLSIPDSAYNIQPRSFEPSRPAGITRSGENDQFFLGVIRALRRTFPEMRTTGVTTIRIILNDKGNILSVTTLRSSGDPILDQSVAFSARQASFPIPPDRSTEADRTFFITYIYH